MKVRCGMFLLLLTLALVLCPLLPAGAEVGSSAPLNPAFLKYLEDRMAGRSSAIDSDHPTGHVPSPLDLSHLKGVATTGRTRGVLPTAYDLRDEGRVTSVKDQDPYGTCWAFATLGSVESFLMGDAASAKTAENRDFSEMHLAWYAYTGDDAFTTKAPAFGDDPILDQGGNLWKSTALLARWTGPVNETDCIYSESERPVGDWSNYTNQKHLTDVHYLLWNSSKTDDLDMKNAVMDYGGVAIAYYATNKYYDPTNYSYYCNGETSSNHEVLLVGWDDAFDKTLFSPDAPSNGAWIVKNSWGTGWGESGYFYLSYNDTSLSDGAAFVVGPKTNYNNVYYYDPLGWCMARGYSNPTGWFANIFTAGNGSAGKSSGTENLAAVSFFTASPNSTYAIRVYTGVTAGDPDSGTLAIGPVAGTLVTPGYHTVALPSTVSLTSGQRFSVVVTLTTPGYNFPIPYECYVAGFSEKATANPGESFISSNGATWTDLTVADATANVCLKAFTTTSTTTPTPTTTVTPTVTHAPTVTGGGSSGGGGCSAGVFAPFALLLFVPLFLKKF